MSKQREAIDADLAAWIAQQHLFFVATAPLAPGGHINASPKGGDVFRVLGPREVVYQDYTGSGAETAAHIRENGRIVIMFCSFDGSPKIVRLHGRGTLITAGSAEFPTLAALFPPNPGTRAFTRVAITRISSSCGFGVPHYEFRGYRDALDKWAANKGPEELRSYRAAKNATSIDGLAAFATDSMPKIDARANAELFSDKFPLASKYNPDWVVASASGGANALLLTEWLATALDLKPNMRVLDLACGRAVSSIFLRREFGVQVWATDLWFSPSENLQRIRDAGVEDGVFPIHADARSLPFASEFFDAIVSIDAFPYFGTDDLYLRCLARFLKPRGVIGIAGSGLTNEMPDTVPEHLRDWWQAEPDLWCLHPAQWWRRHWEQAGILDLELADTMADGWQAWLEWQRAIAPENDKEINAVEADRGRYLGYTRVVGRRREDAQFEDPIVSIPAQYTKKPLLSSEAVSEG